VDGNILGINTSGLFRQATVTVPTPTVKQVVDELLKRGRISRGYLGIGVQPVRLPVQLARQLGQETGLLVISVDSGSPGERAGLVLGDTVLSVGGNPVRHWDDLIACLGKEQIGVTVAVGVLRAGTPQELKATITERA
jgi:S1-C subfamily serine protease